MFLPLSPGIYYFFYFLCILFCGMSLIASYSSTNLHVQQLTFICPHPSNCLALVLLQGTNAPTTIALGHADLATMLKKKPRQKFVLLYLSTSHILPHATKNTHYSEFSLVDLPSLNNPTKTITHPMRKHKSTAKSGLSF